MPTSATPWAAGAQPPSFLRIGSWVGRRPRRQPQRHRRRAAAGPPHPVAAAVTHYLEEIHALGAELSLSTRYAEVCRPGADRAARSVRETTPPSARTSPIAGRCLDSTPGWPRRAPGLAGAAPARPSAFAGRALRRSATSSRPTCESSHASLLAHHGDRFRQGRLADLIRAVDCFGFHLATLDLRQNSDVHERVVGELLDRRPGSAPTTWRLAERPRGSRCWSRSSAHPRPLRSPLPRYGDGDDPASWRSLTPPPRLTPRVTARARSATM